MKRFATALVLGIGAFCATSAQATCAGDFNNDNVVDDADFSIFVQQWDVVDCSDPAMPYGCSADLNHDGVVNEDDFYLFYTNYLLYYCP